MLNDLLLDQQEVIKLDQSYLSDKNVFIYDKYSHTQVI